MVKLAAPLAIAAVVVLVGCGSTTADLPVRFEYSKTTDFQKWKTFRFASERAGDSGGSHYPGYEKMVEKAIAEELTARGYTRIEDGTPDFRVAFDLRFRGTSVPQGGGADPSARSYAGSTPRGTLTVNLLDPQSSKALWSGTISEIKMTPIEPQKRIARAVWRLLVEFPPLTE